jgi:hypothetical protein
MSNRYKGGIISATPPTTNGPFEDGAASGAWTLEQQMQAAAAGTWPTAGNVNPDAFIENLFSTWLYTGNGSTQTITNGIDLAGEGGLVWMKSRSAVNPHFLLDTVRGNDVVLSTNTTAGNSAGASSLFSFGSSGFSLTGSSDVNTNAATYVSWTFREQPKFFDIVTYTGNGTARTIPHNLGSVPGCIIVKSTSNTSNWAVYHRSLTDSSYYLVLNSTSQEASNTAFWNNTAPTATEFSLGTIGTTNGNGLTYVAYLFAHNAGGFGLTGTDNVISCGSYVGDGASAGKFIELGYEPQWVLQKASSASATDWHIQDVMRGAPVNNPNGRVLRPNSSVAEYDGTNAYPAATGFFATGDDNNSGTTYIYVAIRRGPMKVPTTGTSVFSPTTNAGTGSNKTITTNFPVDLSIQSALSAATHVFTDRLRGGGVNLSPRMYSQFTDAETNTSGGRGILFDSNTSITNLSNYNNAIGDNYIYYGMRRAPGFFDEVCYTGTGASRNVNHNLTVVPELMIVKDRTSVRDWVVYSPTIGTSNTLYLNGDNPQDSFTGWGGTPTASTFALTSTDVVNNSGNNYVAYLFASAPGVSKVGSYTGTGATQVINCGFTAGSRFVLIKRTDSTGDWYVWDSARGIIAGNDPYLLLNSTAAEVTNTDFVDTAATGFEISSTAPAAINASGGTFIFLAIA